MREADNLTTLMCRMSWKYGSINLLEPSRPHRACYGNPLLFIQQLKNTKKLKLFSECEFFKEYFELVLDEKNAMCKIYQLPKISLSQRTMSCSTVVPLANTENALQSEASNFNYYSLVTDESTVASATTRLAIFFTVSLLRF